MTNSEIYKGYKIVVTFEDSTNSYSYKIYYSDRDNPPIVRGWNTSEDAFDVAHKGIDWMTSPDYCDLDYINYREFPDFQG